MKGLILIFVSMYTGFLCCLSSAQSSNTTKNDSTAVLNGNNTSTACDSSLLFQKLYVLMPAISTCAKESGYEIKPRDMQYPSAESLDQFCKSDNCTKLSLELDDAGLPSCTINVSNDAIPIKLFFKNIRDQCDDINSPSGNSHARSLNTNSNYYLVGMIIWASTLSTTFFI